MLSKSKNYRGIEKGAINKKNYFIVYTLLFAVAAFTVNFIFIRNGVTYVREVDGLTQHLVALEYYGQWLRDFFSRLFTEHRFEFQNFDFSIGMGSDVVTTLNYYAIGDPLNLLSVFVPREHTAQLYTFLAVLRNYLAGLAFSFYCFERKHENAYGVLASSLLYAFSVFAVVAGPMHPFFVNPMIYLPLLFLAVEKIFENKNPIYLALIVCIAEVSNFYFFYMLVIATVVYVLIRLFSIYGFKLKKMLAPLFKIGLASIIGVLMGAVIFYPVVISFLSDGRAGVEHTYPLFYNVQYYFTLLSSMVYYNGFEPWTLVGSGVLVIYGIAALWLTKKNVGLKLAFLICAAGLCLPAFGGFSNGFSYASNRWCFIFTFVLAFACSQLWDEIFFSDNKIKRFVIAFLPALYAGCCVYMPYAVKSNLKYALVFFALSSAILIVNLLLPQKLDLRNFVQQAIIAVNIVCIGLNSFVVFSGQTDKQFSQKQLNEKISAEFKAVESYTSKVQDTEFYRYTSNKLDYNDAVRNGGFATQYYWSLSDKSISDFQDSVYLNEGFYQYYNGFDDIAAFNTLSSVKYYYDKTNQPGAIPFGFEKTQEQGLYKNKYALPLAYAYDSYVTREELDKLATSPEKQQAMLKSVVLETDAQNVEKSDISCNVANTEFEIIPDSDFVTVSGNSFTVTKKNATVTLKLKSRPVGEVYLSMRGISFKATKPTELFADNKEVDPLNLFNEGNLQQYGYKSVSELKKKVWQEPEILDISAQLADEGGKRDARKLRYYTPAYRFYADKKDFDLYLGYGERGFTTLTVTFSEIGTYSFESIEVLSQSMNHYTQNASKLASNAKIKTKLDVDSINASVSLDESRIILFAVPYLEGWKAFVDGEEVPVMKANLMHMALEVAEGEHEIELVYSSPYIKAGAVVSIFGVVLLFAYGMWYHVSVKKKRVD